MNVEHHLRERPAAGAASVRCIEVHAQVADPAPEVRRARARAVRGDAAWQRRLRRYEHGDATMVALTAFAVIGDRSEPLCFCHEVVWVDRPIAPSALGERLRERARRNFQEVGPRLRDRGIAVDASEDAIAVQVVIDPAVAVLTDP